jgi:hypothetical protein
VSEEISKRQRDQHRNTGSVITLIEGRKYGIKLFEGRDSAGKRHYYYETFHGTKTEAKKRLRELLGKQSRGESLRLSNDTLIVFLDEWRQVSQQ